MMSLRLSDPAAALKVPPGWPRLPFQGGATPLSPRGALGAVFGDRRFAACSLGSVGREATERWTPMSRLQFVDGLSNRAHVAVCAGASIEST
jgi:hypothetical protein